MSEPKEQKTKSTMSWVNGRGKKETREVNLALGNIQEFRGTPGYAWLVIAANPHLSQADVLKWLKLMGVGRTASWVRRRRWMFQQPGVENSIGRKPNADGLDEWAQRIMAENSTLSVRRLTWVLKEKGIRREREWVRTHRVVPDE